MIKLKQINLPVFLIGAGIVHAIGIAVLLPMLITLPGAGGEIEPKAVAVDVDIVPAPPPSPKVEPEVDQTSALPAAPQTPEGPESAGSGGSTAQPEQKDASPQAVANVSPESAPSTEEPAADAAPVTEQKTKVESKGRKPAKLTRTAPKKRVFSGAKGKSVARRPARSKTNSEPPYKGPFSALFNAPVGATANKRK